jgi:dipeptidase E
MIILTSNGLSSDTLLAEVRNFTAKLKKAVIITTASVGYKEKDWHMPRLTVELESLGLSVDTFNFDHQDAPDLLDFDVIEILGGNPFYLLSHLQIEENKAILQQIAETKVLIGISAGTLVLQQNIQLVAQFSPEMNEDVGLTDLTGLALTDLEILPHYHRYMDRFENLEEQARAYERANNCTVTRLDDGEAIFIVDDQIYRI